MFIVILLRLLQALNRLKILIVQFYSTGKAEVHCRLSRSQCKDFSISCCLFIKNTFVIMSKYLLVWGFFSPNLLLVLVGLFLGVGVLGDFFVLAFSGGSCLPHLVTQRQMVQ